MGVSHIRGSRVSWLDRLAGMAGRLAGTRGAVLCLHGLDVENTPSPSSMHISQEHFEAIVSSIRGVGRLVPLDDLVARHLGGRSTAGLVAFTADDAYASWLGAEQLLTRLEVPLTIFAVSDALANGLRFWWDRIDETASRAGPERWRRFESDCGLPEAYRLGHPVSEGVVRPLRQWILAEHAGRWPAALEALLTGLEDDVGHCTPQRSMTEAELSGFLARTGAQVGVHTKTHAALPFLSDDEVVAEIRDGHEELRMRFPSALPYLAIPFGLFDSRTIRLTAEGGMTASFTLEGHPLDREVADDLGMPRFCVVREQGPGMLAIKASKVAALVRGTKGRRACPYPALPSPTT